MKREGRKKKKRKIRRKGEKKSCLDLETSHEAKRVRSAEIILRPALVKVISGTRTLDLLAAQGQTPFIPIIPFLLFF